MKQSKKKTKTKMAGKKNLSIVNQGDSIVIRNRAATSASVAGAILLGLCLVGLLVLKDAWNLAYFWLLFGVVLLCALYTLAKILFAKIVLDSPKKLMIVYNPLPNQYKFEDVNYVDLRTEKGNEGLTLYVVTVYIGVGKRTVKLISFSKEQAEELAILLRGMLDNGAMVYPEGDEEPFSYESRERAAALKPKTERKLFNFKIPGKSAELDTKPDKKPDTNENSGNGTAVETKRSDKAFTYESRDDLEFKCIMRRRDNTRTEEKGDNK